MEEERMVHKPEEANSDEGAEIGEELGAVDLHGCSQAPAKLLLHNGWVWDVVLAERQLPKNCYLLDLIPLVQPATSNTLSCKQRLAPPTGVEGSQNIQTRCSSALVFPCDPMQLLPKSQLVGVSASWLRSGWCVAAFIVTYI